MSQGAPEGGSARIFVALELAEQARTVLAREGERLGELDPTLRPVRVENLHLTLAFLGTIARERLLPIEQALREELAEVSAFRLDLAGLGAFPDTRRPRVVWVGVRDPAAVIEVERRVCSGLRRAEVDLEPRDFRAHVTLARLRKSNVRPALRSAIEDSRLKGFATSEVVEAVLFESQLGREGASYRVLARFPFFRHPA